MSPTSSSKPAMKEIRETVISSHTHTPEDHSKARYKPKPAAIIAAALMRNAVMGNYRARKTRVREIIPRIIAENRLTLAPRDNLEQFVLPVGNTPTGIGTPEFFAVEIMHPGLAQQAP